MKIELQKNALVLNGHTEVLPIHIDRLREIIGEPSRGIALQYNTIYTWDELGIYVHSKNGTLIETINLSVAERDKFAFLPHKGYKGIFEVEGESYTTRAFEKKRILGAYSIFSMSTDTTDMHYAEISISLKEKAKELVQKALDTTKYQLRQPDEKCITFHDFNFKLAVVQVLMYEKKLLKPEFDVYEFVKFYQKRKIDIEDEGYSIIPEVREYFEALPVPERLAAEVTRIYQDGGNKIYGELYPFWDGEDEIFNITSAADLEAFPNLKKVTLFYDENPACYQALEAKGVEVSYL
jgi:hypothetical protein